jgi:diguanylate cyclase (GGDEF)-like protein/excisionase family DNA binding protein
MGSRVGKADGETWLRLGDAAELLGVSLNTMRRWSDAGRVSCYRSSGGHRRYKRRDVELLLVQQADGGAPAPQATGQHDVESMRAALAVIARAAAEGLGVSSCLVTSCEAGRLRALAEYSGSGSHRYAMVGEAVGRNDAPLAYTVVSEGRRIVVADLGHTTVLDPDEAAAYRAYGDRALLVQPLRDGSRVIGAMELVESRIPRTFSGPNIAFAEFMGRQAAAVIAQNLPGRRQARGGVIGAPVPAVAHAELTLAAETAAPRVRLGQEVAAPDLTALLTAVAQRTAQALAAEGCDILAPCADEHAFELLAAHGAERAGAPARLHYPCDESDGAWLATVDRQPHVTQGPPLRLLGSGDAEEHASARWSVLNVPAMLGDRTLAVLQVFDDAEDRSFAPEAVAVAIGLGGVAALALAANRTHELLSARAVAVDDLAAFAVDISRNAATEGLVRATIERVVAASPATSRCALHKVDADSVTTIIVWSHGAFAAEPPDVEWTLSDCGPAAAAAGERRPAFIADLTDPRLSAAGREHFFVDRGLKSGVFIPLVFGVTLVGLLELGSEDEEAYTSLGSEITFAADTIAAVLATSDLAGLLQRHNRDLSLVVDAGLQDSAMLSTDDILHSVAQRLADLTNSPVADIYAVEGDTLRALVSYDGHIFDTGWEGVTVPLSRYPCSKLAAESGQVAVAASLDDPVLTPEGRYSLEKWGYQSQASVPLIAHGRVIGIAELSDYVPRDFAEDLALILGLSRVAANALENAALFEQIEHRNAILRELVELGTVIAQTRAADDLLRAVAGRLLAIVDAANCDIFRIEGDALRCLVSFDRSGFDERTIGNVLDLGNYPATVMAVTAHETLVLASPDDPRLSDHERRVFREFGFASEICVPLYVNDEPFGLIDISDTRARTYAEYLDFLKTVAQLVSAALENVLLLDQLGRRTTVLRELVELGALTSQPHDLDELLETIAGRLRQTIGAADCDIFTLDGDQFRCRVSVDEGGRDDGIESRPLDLEYFPSTAAAIAAREVLVIADVDDPRLTEHELRDYAEFSYRSELCIPLVAGDRAIGLIDIFDTQPRDYAEYVDFLKSVGRMVAGAIENATLLNELAGRNDELRELVELGAVVSEQVDVDQLVRTVAQRVVALTSATGCQIFRLEGDTLRCLITYENGLFDEDFVGRPLDLVEFPSTAEALEKRVPLVITSPDDPRLTEYERRLYAESGSQSELCVPLIVDDRVVGLLDVYDVRPRDYAECLHFVASVGQAVAGAFETKLLLERLEDGNRRLGVLVDSSLEFGATLELEELLSSVARRMCDVADAACCDVSSTDGQRLLGLVSVHDGMVSASYPGTQYDLAELGLATRAVDERQPVLCADRRTDPRVTEFEHSEWDRFGFCCSLQLPLIHRGEVIGLVSLFDREPREFDHVDLLQGLAQIAANALANATLYRELDTSAGRLAIVNELSIELASSLDPEEVLLNTARRLCSLIDVPSCDIYTIEGEDRLRCIASILNDGLDEEWLSRDFRLSDWGAVACAVASRDVVAISDLSDKRLTDSERELMLAFGERSELALPLISKDKVIGAVELLETRYERVWTNEEIAIVSAVCRVAALAIYNANLYEDIKHMHLSNLKALSSALNAKDYYTLGHAARVSAYMVLLGEELGWPAELVEQVEEAAYLHDIGKIGVSDRILLKPTGLNEREWELMRQHPIFSADIIKPLFAPELVQGVRHHHERYDGSGYPDGLAGKDIPEIARAMCVVDAYDAMSFRRPYRQALTYPECLAELRRCSKHQFDPAMVKAFVRVLGRLDAAMRRATEIAEQGAALIDPAEHALLRTPEDEERSEYRTIAEMLRHLRDANPPTRFITTQVRRDNKFVMIVDSEEEGSERSHIGDEVFADEGLVEIASGVHANTNVLYVDEFGVWVSGVAKVLDQHGDVAAVVSADLPAPAGGTRLEGLRSDVSETFASMLHQAAARLGRAELEAITDGLTGLYNHRYLHERLGEEVERALEHGTEVALLLCDIDDFKTFNHLHGHEAGDRVLRGAARIIEGCVRHVDLASRYGGEEFAVILIDTGRAGARDVAERIRQGINGARLSPAKEALTVSIGIAVCPGDAEGKEELIDKADWAMYLAKRKGRDRVMMFAAELDEAAQSLAGGERTGAALVARLLLTRDAYERSRAEVLRQLEEGGAAGLGLRPDELALMARTLGGDDETADQLAAALDKSLSLDSQQEQGPGSSRSRPGGGPA